VLAASVDDRFVTLSSRNSYCEMNAFHDQLVTNNVCIKTYNSVSPIFSVLNLIDQALIIIVKQGRL